MTNKNIFAHEAYNVHKKTFAELYQLSMQC